MRWMISDQRKRTVETVRSISISDLRRWGFLKESKSGIITWFSYDDLHVSIETRIPVVVEAWGSVRFRYDLKKRETGVIESFDYLSVLSGERCHFGGFRWHFGCPMPQKEGGFNRVCARQVRTLYLRGDYFGCRHCYDLTYARCQFGHHFTAPHHRYSGMRPRLMSCKLT